MHSSSQEPPCCNCTYLGQKSYRLFLLHWLTLWKTQWPYHHTILAHFFRFWVWLCPQNLLLELSYGPLHLQSQISKDPWLCGLHRTRIFRRKAFKLVCHGSEHFCMGCLYTRNLWTHRRFSLLQCYVLESSWETEALEIALIQISHLFLSSSQKFTELWLIMNPYRTSASWHLLPLKPLLYLLSRFCLASHQR